MSKNLLPIAIDLGAKNTGVFSAFYSKQDRLENIKYKKGIVYELSKDSYTLLMDSRTANRHQKRGFDRKQLVKRLFKLIWTKQLNLEWDNATQQTISFLLNRRGFSFLEEKHDTELLKNFPATAIAYLPKALRIDTSEKEDYDINDKIFETLEQDTFTGVYSEIENNIATVKKEIVKANIVNLIKLAIDTKIDTGEIVATKKNKFDELKKVSLWIVESLFEPERIAYLEQLNNYSKNIFTYLDSLNDEELKQIKQVLPAVAADEHKDSIWNFNISSFKLDNQNLINKLELGDVKTHIHHLAFALYNIKKELDEGSRHRSQYFEEVASVLLERNHQELYLKDFCEKLHNGKYAKLNIKQMVNLIGNLSNLELKPLRKYFNDIAHTKGDYWSEKRFAEFYCRWILGEWRVGAKDKDKQPNGRYSYKALAQNLKQKVGTTQDVLNNQLKGSVIEFLLELDPHTTIPPYQDNNNRKPPKCQSLILNSKFLDNKYPQWQKYLEELKQLDSIQSYLGTFEVEQKALKTGKNLPYFVAQKSLNKQIASGQRDYKDLDARVLQFIFDRVKVSDDLLLNEIYSQAKKVKQNASSQEDKAKATQKLEKAIVDSNLPNYLKAKHTAGIFAKGSFLHLVCKYYKYRQRARDSRLYIMSEYHYDKKLDKYNNTGRFVDSQLLTYCNHKPRQKRYQLLNDLAGALQIAPKLLAEKVGFDSEAAIIEWLKSFKIASYCKTSVEMQKQYRGTLKNEIQTAIFKKRLEAIKKNKKATNEEKSLLEKYKNAKSLTTDEKKIATLVENINKVSQQIGDNLGLADKQIAKFSSIHSFAQIQQIAFVERSGNVNTCAVCSADNAYRMQQIKITEATKVDKNNSSDSAKAQRLPAIPTRVVDGAVKKMATILARNIADDNWDNIKQALELNQELHIPIITESNSFEFEPALANVKGKNLKDKRKKALEKIKPENVFKDKNNRIKSFANGISAYSGANLVNSDYDGAKEELDHIIPRSHKKYGTLNDEANLICVTREDNKNKGNTSYYLANLADSYKQNQFDTTNSQEIESWIVATIWDDNRQDFKFGNYRSFINLAPEQQKAFRHALFLMDDNPVKQAVIKAINNRNRAFVNGTQRYFAEVLANNIYLRAKKEKLATEKLSFDYFGVETTNTAGRGIADIRKLYEFIDDDITAYTKGDKPQDNYSHLIDAMLAFCVAADSHKNDGSIGLELEDSYSLHPFDGETGEVFTQDIFSKIKVSANEFEAKSLARRKAYTVETNIRQQIQSRGDFEKAIPYQIHRDSIIAEKFFPILEIKGNWKFGFSISNSVAINKQDIELIKEFLIKSKEYNEYTVWLINKTQAQEYLINIGYMGADIKQEKVAKILDKIAYYIVKKDISSILTKANKAPETVEEAIGVFDELVFKDKKGKLINFVKSGVILPIYNDWLKLKNTMLKAEPKQKLQDFLANYFKNTNIKNKHQKVRKNFSLPIIATIGSIRLRRKSWDKENIYQLVAEENLAKYGFDGKSRPKTILSKNSVPISHYSGVETKNIIEPLSWITLNLDDLLDETIISAHIKNRSAGQVSIKVELSSLENICLKQDNWSGSIVYSKENEDSNIVKNDKFYIKKDEYFWLKDFSLMFDSGKTKATLSIKKTDNGHLLEFVSAKGKKEKCWLKNETFNN